MSTLKAHTLMTSHPEMRWMKRFGWYGIAFFLIKGALWLIAPFIIYTVN
jgi:hypothetical protein